MSELILVEEAGTNFYVEVSEVKPKSTIDFRGAKRVPDAESFEGVADTISAIGNSLSQAWQAVQPDEATVEFGLKLTTKTGKLAGLLVEGGGEATLKVSLSWKKA